MGAGTLIIGAGVVGLGIGWKLAQAGEQVIILERGLAGREASWAAAGMLCPANEAHYQQDSNLELAQECMRLYPEFVQELEACSGMNVDYRTEGTLTVALNADDAAAVKVFFEYQLEKGLPVRWLSGDEAREMEPQLSNFVSAGISCPMDHQIDNRKMMEALKRAFLKAGGELHEQTEVTHVRCDGGKYRGVMAGEREWLSERLVLAAGSWSGLVSGIPEHVRPPVRPVKGQMFSLRAPFPGFITRVIRAPDIYISPKSDGRIVFGATVEEMGFDAGLTAGGLYSLLKGAWETVPGTYDLPIDEMWSGFRPSSRDNTPLMGASRVEGLFIATGHHRHGILFAPATAIHMSRLILEGEPPQSLLPFDPSRFTV
ncbi:MAG: glycine oxidase ThiO [SAR324 cluster bacterium]|nr:glycine oxidase ThiO [SAR324 cluster bacterium]MCZ6626648.1 glycine oxidase ThiO [SAR324 cluster bacterium]